VTLEIRRGAKRLSTLVSGLLQPGSQHVVWDGRVGGTRVRDGSYTASITAMDAVTTLKQEIALVIDTTPPRLRLVSLRRLSFRVSEPATLTLDVNGTRVVRAVRAGLVRVPFAGVPTQLTAVAVDAAGNRSKAVRSP
jgi:hypothetical protein